MQSCTESLVSALVAEYGQLNAIDTAGWTITFTQNTCMVWGIPAIDEARGLRKFLRHREMLAQVVPPTSVVTSWSVVATNL